MKGNENPWMALNLAGGPKNGPNAMHQASQTSALPLATA